MTKTTDILDRVRNHELDVATAETMLRKQILEDYEQDLKYAEFTVEIFSEQDAPDGISDLPRAPRHLLYSVVEVHRVDDDDPDDSIWCDDQGHEICPYLVSIDETGFGAGIASWSDLSRYSVLFGSKYERVNVHVTVRASKTKPPSMHS